MRLNPNEVRAAYFAVSTCRRALAGRTVPPSVNALAARLETVMRCGEAVTRSRQADDTATGESKSVNTMEFVGTRLAAQMLGWSLSTVLRHTADLDGRMVGQRWLFPTLAVEEYRDGITKGKEANA